MCLSHSFDILRTSWHGSKMVVIVSHISGLCRTWCLPGEKRYLADIIKFLQNKEEGICDVTVWRKTCLLVPDEAVGRDDIVLAIPRLRGGKGGFGSMLRAIGAQIEKTTNREACRDLSGRRLRDINEEKRVKAFLAKKEEKERETYERKMKKYEKLNEDHKHIFEDKSFFEQREKIEQSLYDSLDKAFGSTNPLMKDLKRSLPELDGRITKKQRFLDDLHESSDESSDDDSHQSDIDEASTSRAARTNAKNFLEVDNERNVSSKEECLVSVTETVGAKDAL